MLACRLTGHRLRFSSADETMTWTCERCGEGGSKVYPTPADAAMYARAFDRDPRRELGRRAPLVGLLPLRLWRTWRDRGAKG